MVRPRVARGFVNLADAVLHQCIRPLIGACCAPGHHGYQRAFELISGQASNGPFGSPLFACAGKTDPPSSSHPLADLGVLVTSSMAPHFALFRCSCLAVVHSSRPARADAPRARGRQGRPSRCPDVLLYRCQAALRLWLLYRALKQPPEAGIDQSLCCVGTDSRIRLGAPTSGVGPSRRSRT